MLQNCCIFRVLTLRVYCAFVYLSGEVTLSQRLTSATTSLVYTFYSRIMRRKLLFRKYYIQVTAWYNTVGCQLRDRGLLTPVDSVADSDDIIAPSNARKARRLHKIQLHNSNVLHFLCRIVVQCWSVGHLRTAKFAASCQNCASFPYVSFKVLHTESERLSLSTSAEYSLQQNTWAFSSRKVLTCSAAQHISQARR